MALHLQLRRDTAANWTAENPVLSSGEIGIETDTRLIKIGDGSSEWADLDYQATATATALNTPNAIVARDSSGDFAARNITATLFNGPAATANAVAVANVTGLLSGGKILSSLLPAIAITDTFVVASQVAMLALTAQTGDVAVRSDLNKSFILRGTDPTVLGDWQELLTPTDAVLSVAGRTGAVTLISSDITDATAASTANRMVLRDGSGGFAAAAVTVTTLTGTGVIETTGSTNFRSFQATNDTASINIRNSTPTNVIRMGTEAAWQGSGSNFTDAAIGAFGANLRFYVAGAAGASITVTASVTRFHGQTGNEVTYLQMVGGAGAATHYNWQIAKSDTVANAFEITPSTAAGGTTFTTPVFKITQAGAATITGSLTSPALATTASNSATFLLTNAAARNVAYMTNGSNAGISGGGTDDGAWLAYGKIYFCTNNSNTPAFTLTTALAGVLGAGLALNGAAAPDAGLLLNNATPASPANGCIYFDGSNYKGRIGGVSKTFTVT